MPTPILPLLHAILDALHIPILPSALRSTSPSLLLLMLESIMGTKLPIPMSLRRPDLDPKLDASASSSSRAMNSSGDHGREAREIELVKCLLGVLDEQLGKDLTVVDPRRVVVGYEEELGVIIMAMTVLARRRGILVAIPASNLLDDDDEMLEQQWADDVREGVDTGYHRPLRPDISLSPRMEGHDGWNQRDERDVFAHAKLEGRPKASASLLFDMPPRNTTRDLSTDLESMKTSQTLLTPLTESYHQFETPLPLKYQPESLPTHLEVMASAQKVLAGIDPASEERDRHQGRPLTADADDLHYNRHDDKVYRYLSSSTSDASHGHASSSTTGTGNSSRTVLDEIIEEFGLAPGT